MDMDVNGYGENPILHRGNKLGVVHFTVGSSMMSFLKMFWNGLLASMNINTMYNGHWCLLTNQKYYVFINNF